MSISTDIKELISINEAGSISTKTNHWKNRNIVTIIYDAIKINKPYFILNDKQTTKILTYISSLKDEDLENYPEMDEKEYNKKLIIQLKEFIENAVKNKQAITVYYS